MAQDNAYLHPESWKVLQVTAWIPMLDATPHNGCMQVRCCGSTAAKLDSHSVWHWSDTLVLISPSAVSVPSLSL